MRKTRKLKLLQRNHGVILKHQTFQLKLNYHVKDAGRQCVFEFGPSSIALPGTLQESLRPGQRGQVKTGAAHPAL